MPFVSESWVKRKLTRLRPSTITARFCILIQGVDNPDQAARTLLFREAYLDRIFIYLSKYAVGCYLCYCGFPRRTLLETVWKVLRTSQPPDHEPRHRRVDKCLSGGAQPLINFGH